MGSRLEKQSNIVRKQIESHIFDNEQGEEYDNSKFGGFSDYFRRKRLKLQNLDAEIRSKSVDKPQIFRGTVVHVNGYTQPSLSDIHHLVVSHGGGFLQYLDGKTAATHIIAANLTPKKVIEFQKYRVVNPSWVVDSVAAGRILPWAAYNVLQEGSAQRRLGLNAGNFFCQVKTNSRSYVNQTKNSWYTGHVEKFVNHVNEETEPQSLSSRNLETDTLGSRENDSKLENHETLSNSSSCCSLSSMNLEVTLTLEEVLNKVKNLDSHHEQDTISNGVSLMENNIQTPSALKIISKQKSELDKGNLSISKYPQQQIAVSGAQINSLGSESRYPILKSRKITAKENNAHLITDSDIRKSTASNPDFIAQYFSESRLHHLSVWKAEIKSRLQKLTAKKSGSSEQIFTKNSGLRRYILHVDFDCFFCAVSLKNKPEWSDKPVAVAHSRGPGAEIASCNYPAREIGVKNGMWMKNALNICPQLKILPYDFPAYEAVCNQFYEIILRVGGKTQSVSVDEALLDVTSLCQGTDDDHNVMMNEAEEILREQEKAEIIAAKLRKQIKGETGCEVSIGIGPNIFLARVALRKAKPAGQFQLKPEDALAHIGKLSVRDLPGVAHSIGGKLEENGIKLVEDVRQLLNKERLMILIGPKTGEKIWRYSQGIDGTEVGVQAKRNSVSAEVNWGIRFISQQEVEDFVQNLCVELQRRLVDQKVRGKQLTMKIMKRSAGAPLDPSKHLGHGICDTYSRSITFGIATNRAEVIGREALFILRSYGFSPSELRGLGVQMTKLEVVKATVGFDLDESQLRIDFGIPAPSKAGQKSPDNPIDDESINSNNQTNFSSTIMEASKIDLDERIGKRSMALQKPKCSTKFLNNKDPIDDDTQSKSCTITTNSHPASAILRLNSNDPFFSSKPLNVTGTQFIIPSQIDPNVLEELPRDLQAKLVAQSKIKNTSENDALTSAGPQTLQSMDIREYSSRLPSQLDLEVFCALPDDLKTEVLATCRTGHHVDLNRPAIHPKAFKSAEPMTKKSLKRRKRGRARPIGLGNKRDPHQLSFLTFSDRIRAHNSKEESDVVEEKEGRESDRDNSKPETESDSFKIDEDFLSALPEDVRFELLAEQKRKQWNLAQGSLHRCAGPLTGKKQATEQGNPTKIRKIVLPKRPARPTFTTQKLSSLVELRETTSAWFDEFSSDGPYPEDVSALVRYLRRVVLEEKDLGKVVSVVRWLEYLVESTGQNESAGTNAWLSACENIKSEVQLAVQERGLGRVDFS